MTYIKRILKKIFPSKEMRKYNKMCRKHRKELRKFIKQIKPYDYRWFHDITMMQLRHMREYYLSGNNVFQSEESAQEIVNKLDKIIALDDGLKELSLLDIQFDNEERNQFEKIYSIIGQNITNWWD